MCRNKSVNQLADDSDYDDCTNATGANRPQSESTSPDSYAFTIHTVSKLDNLDRVDVCVGGSKVRAIVDTGADCNVVSMVEWERLKSEGVKVARSRKGGTSKVYSYASQRPLIVMGEFWADVSFQSNDDVVSDVKFLVVVQSSEFILFNTLYHGSDNTECLQHYQI